MLAVDIGNTFTRIASFGDGRILARSSLYTRDLRVPELIAAFEKAADSAELPEAWIASVAPPANAVVDSAAQRAGLRRRFIKPGSDFILPHTLRTPETTGVDRLLAAMAAGARHFSGSAKDKGYVVLQCGSAATVDLVDRDGVFRGGYILPGPAMWLEGVSQGAQLPNLSAELPEWKLVTAGDNTRDAIMHGMQLTLPVATATAAMLISVEGQSGEGLPVAVTGGWGEAVLPYVRAEHVYDRDLLLHGIRYFAQMHG